MKRRSIAFLLIIGMLMFGAAPLYAQHSSSHEEATAVKTFSPEELAKLKPEQICLIHKCKMGVCLIITPEEAAELGKCPHCGEDLTQVLETAKEAANQMAEGRVPVTLTPEKQQYLGVKLGKVERRELAKEINTVGRIAFDPELYQAQKEFQEALSFLKKSEESPIPETKEIALSNVDAIKTRLRLLGLSEDQISEMQAHPHDDKSLILPGAKEGIWMYAPVYEYELGYLKPGQEMIVKVPAFPGKIFKGNIRAIDPVLDPLTRTARVRTLLDNSEGLLRPEMYANAMIKIDLGEGLAVPKEAIFNTGKEKIVFVSLGEGRYEPRMVETGLEGSDFAEIKSGLNEGEEVVLSGNFLIDSESRLKASLGAMGGHAGMGKTSSQKGDS